MLLPDVPLPEAPELSELPVPDDPDVPGGFVSAPDVPDVPESVAPEPEVPVVVPELVVPVLPDPAVPELVAPGLVLSELEVPAAEPDPAVEPVELELLGLGVVEPVEPEPAELEGVLLVVPPLCSSDLPQPANITLSTPAASIIFVV